MTAPANDGAPPAAQNLTPSTAAAQQPSADIQKALSEFLFITIPAVVLYFIGWAYLYFFLGAFGTNIAEIHMDTPTIFIYSFSPLRVSIMDYGAAVVGGALLIWIVVKYLPDQMRAPLKRNYDKTIAMISRLPRGFKISILLVGLIILAVGLVPIIKWTAIQASDRLWAGQGVNTLALLSDKDAKPSSGSTKKAKPDSLWRAAYNACLDRQALILIYSDENAYYFLCRSTVNANEGLVFEVRREIGLVSVRFVTGGQS